MAKSFPCPYCKGRGSWIEAVLDDGSGPEIHCGFCEGLGMIEVDGVLHRQIKEINKPKDELWEMIAEKDYALTQVIDALQKLGLDGWSEAPYLMQECLKARAFPKEP